MFEHFSYGGHDYGTTHEELQKGDFIILEPHGVAHYRENFQAPLTVIQLDRSNIDVDPARRLRDMNAGYGKIHPDYFVTGDTIQEMSQNLKEVVEFVLTKDKFLETVGKAGWTEFQNHSTKMHPNSICLENKEYPYMLFFTSPEMAKSFARTISLASHIHDFLADSDPAFGYAEGLPGQRNAQEFTETFRRSLFGEPWEHDIYSLSEDKFLKFNDMFFKGLDTQDPHVYDEILAIVNEAASFVSHKPLMDRIQEAEKNIKTTSTHTSKDFALQ